MKILQLLLPFFFASERTPEKISTALILHILLLLSLAFGFVVGVAASQMVDMAKVKASLQQHQTP